MNIAEINHTAVSLSVFTAEQNEAHQRRSKKLWNCQGHTIIFNRFELSVVPSRRSGLGTFDLWGPLATIRPAQHLKDSQQVPLPNGVGPP